MEKNSQVDLALKYCKKFHEGQFRKGNKSPYHTHPIEVAEILKKYGYDDEVTLCLALLHDTIEDTELKIDEIEKAFGEEISKGVDSLSKVEDESEEWEGQAKEKYLSRISASSEKVKRVKIADMIHNTRDLETLGLESIKRKIKESEEYFIPLGKEISPEMIKELIGNIENYKKKFQNN